MVVRPSPTEQDNLNQRQISNLERNAMKDKTELELLLWLKENNLLDNHQLPQLKEAKQKYQRDLKNKAFTKQKERYFLETDPSSPLLGPQSIEDLFKKHEKDPKTRIEELTPHLIHENWFLRNLAIIIGSTLLSGFLLPSFPYKFALLFLFFVSLSTTQILRFLSFTKAWDPKFQMARLKDEFYNSLQLLDESGVVTTGQKSAYIKWAKPQLQARIQAIQQDPSTPVDGLPFEQEARLLIVTQVRRQIVNQERTERKRLKAHRRRQHSQRQKKPAPKPKSPCKAELQAKLQREAEEQSRLEKEAAERQKQKAEQEKAKKRTALAQKITESFNKTRAGLERIRQRLVLGRCPDDETIFVQAEEELARLKRQLMETTKQFTEQIESKQAAQSQEIHQGIEELNTKIRALRQLRMGFLSEVEQFLRGRTIPLWLDVSMGFPDEEQIREEGFIWYLKANSFQLN